ncbi:MAG TPA: hypothetical protein VGH02_01945 [Rhizomicrobium sp.]
MSLELTDLSPEERAGRYRAKAEEARRMAATSTDSGMRQSLQEIANDWECLAVHTHTLGKPR